jgi:hypothetical protein
MRELAQKTHKGQKTQKGLSSFVPFVFYVFFCGNKQAFNPNHCERR